MTNEPTKGASIQLSERAAAEVLNLQDKSQEYYLAQRNFILTAMETTLAFAMESDTARKEAALQAAYTLAEYGRLTTMLAEH